ncbi:division/cell wall cluster transcriptional repressor MraZ [Desulfosarcina ovata]|uniref:Transcriptional regulator MraZ n=2 Tax=Desulfosarcina ovata TaxID=83564 RepID=A0A5K8AGE6_9BACT|nr:division/cell wall cluster transcriptional repressor MraZ [Desulfosarcina ovata]BBO82962.1 transcriptional regulator MraZ [Desulfosarcina ovata subsp. sediminis]BBO91628.1 transcriptional regulator MraZ [Desulfosarcina ovata subsp. ovata]
MFRGSSFHTIDPKGRIIIPTRFRDVLKAGGDERVMITCMDDCLFAYTLDEWSKLEQKILHLPQKSESMRRFQRIFIGGAHDCKCDGQGRVLIPPFLKKYAGLEKEIVLVGVLDRFEIWSQDNWDRENGQMAKDMGDDQVRQEIAQLGL